MSGVIDEPLKCKSDSEDTLGIDSYAQVLSRFVKETNTPMTVGIQGEWGSGKTSLLNSVWAKLEQGENLLIWINTWEYSLLTSPEEALIKIIVSITEKISACDRNKNSRDKILSATKSLVRGAAKIGAGVTLGSNAAQVVDELLENNNNTIQVIRQALADSVSDISNRTTNPYQRIVIFVDDLDRLDPVYAVQILELLKNIFSIEKCVFLLAIDYQVVVKGLKHKFGELTEHNEWEFRAFFDKIIQLPFMMPMSDYNIGRYIHELLQKINYLEKDDIEETSLEAVLDLTLGGNPRSIKRLVNSLLLITMMTEVKKTKMQDKFLLFTLVCIQITYPTFYVLLRKHPDFLKLTQEDAFVLTNGKEANEPTFNETLAQVKKTSFFDEEWEQVLFRVAFLSPYTKNRAIEISSLFNYIREYVESSELVLKTAIEEAISITGITNVVATDSSENDQKIARSPFSLEKSNLSDEDLRNELLNTLSRQTSLTPRLITLFEILLAEKMFITREEIKQRFFAKGIGENIGHAGRLLSNVSQFITKKANPHLRQIIEFESDGGSGASKTNYRLLDQYRELVYDVISSIRKGEVETTGLAEQ